MAQADAQRIVTLRRAGFDPPEIAELLGVTFADLRAVQEDPDNNALPLPASGGTQTFPLWTTVFINGGASRQEQMNVPVGRTEDENVTWIVILLEGDTLGLGFAQPGGGEDPQVAGTFAGQLHVVGTDLVIDVTLNRDEQVGGRAPLHLMYQIGDYAPWFDLNGWVDGGIDLTFLQDCAVQITGTITASLP
jgi:hypothetical protein